MIELAKGRGVQLLLPKDVRVSESLSEPACMEVTDLTRFCCTADKPCIPAGELPCPPTSPASLYPDAAFTDKPCVPLGE